MQLTWQLSASLGLRVGERIYFTLGFLALYCDTVTGEATIATAPTFSGTVP